MSKIIVWFRRDLRLADNPALLMAAQQGQIIPLYILDDDNAGPYKMGGASRWWLDRSLKALDQSLGGRLQVIAGKADILLPSLTKKWGATGLYYNRCYEPWRISRDTKIKQALSDQGMDVKSFNGSLLWEPWEVHKADGTPYRVFTPYFRKGCMAAAPPTPPQPAPSTLEIAAATTGQSVDDLQLAPTRDWAKDFPNHWTPSEQGAQDRLEAFIGDGLQGYKKGRDFPATAQTSGLSPHLHFGEISPQQIWHRVHPSHPDSNEDYDHFRSELAWREFSYALLYHFPDLPHANFNKSFDHFPWQTDAHTLKRWQHGQTGIPFVDAAMRELWQTGTMHNRARMVVASFLVKNLMIDWRAGAAWFWDTLLDADLANNSASWQWVAGSGADAAPYFRIFNAVTQGEKFDKNGAYTRRFLPELANLPDKYLHQPWTAPAPILEGAGVKLGTTYPKPMVDLKGSRQAALTAYQQTRTAAQALNALL